MQSLQICSDSRSWATAAPATAWPRRYSHSTALRIACNIIMETFEDFKHFGANLSSSFFEDKLPTPEKPSPGFPQFQRLPIELRLAIWEYALPEATVIPRIWNNDKHKFVLSRKVPSVLQACRESRQALITGRPDRERSNIKYQLTSTPGGVFVNWARDSIWISRGYNISDVEVAAYASLRSLVMDWGLRPCWVESSVEEGVEFVRRFPSLEIVTLLVEFSEYAWPDSHSSRSIIRCKRREVKRIGAVVRTATKKTKERNPEWRPPEVRVVHRTVHWSRKDAPRR